MQSHWNGSDYSGKLSRMKRGERREEKGGKRRGGHLEKNPENANILVIGRGGRHMLRTRKEAPERSSRKAR